MQPRRIVVLSKLFVDHISRVVKLRILSDEPYQVFGHVDSASALKVAGPDNCPNLVIVQVDELMPDNDLLTYVRQIRTHNNHIPFIFLINDNAEKLKVLMPDLGFTGLSFPLMMDGQIDRYRRTRDENEHPYLDGVVARYNHAVAACADDLEWALKYIFESWRKKTSLYSGNPIT